MQCGTEHTEGRTRVCWSYILAGLGVVAHPSVNSQTVSSGDRRPSKRSRRPAEVSPTPYLELKPYFCASRVTDASWGPGWGQHRCSCPASGSSRDHREWLGYQRNRCVLPNPQGHTDMDFLGEHASWSHPVFPLSQGLLTPGYQTPNKSSPL